MTNMKKITSLFALLAVAVVTASAQNPTPPTSPYTTTTTTAAVSASSTSGGNVQTLIPLTSVTNVLAPGVNQAQGGLGSPTGGPNETGLFIDRELMRVNSVTGLNARVERGVQGTQTSGHISGATVYVAPFASFVQREYFGSCDPTMPNLPQINTNTGAIYNCPSVGPYTKVWEITGYTGPPGAGNGSNDTSTFGNVSVGVLHFQYNFTNDGGAASSTIIPKNNGTIPANSIITGCLIDATTAGVGAGSLSIGVSGTGGGVNILLAATAAASVTGILQCAIVPQTASGFKKITTAGTGEVATTVGTITAGIVDVFVFYETNPL